MMWVRNQYKTGLVQVSCVDAIGCKVMCRNWTLGVYDSKERAIQVIDLIHQHINSCTFAELQGETYAKVFTMPEK